MYKGVIGEYIIMPRKKTTTEGESLIQPRKRKKDPQKKLIELQQADGKLYNKHNVRSIDELLGVVSSKYAVTGGKVLTDIRQYEEHLTNLNTSDLQAHAAKVGVMPNHDRNILVKRLLKEFRISNSGALNTAQPVNPISKKIRQETLDILSEGR